MAYPIVIVPGTNAFGETWWLPISAFSRELVRRGFKLADENDPYIWDTKLDGLFGKNEVWCAAGRALRWYAQAKTAQPIPSLCVIAHSHGGQVAAYAASHGLYIDVLITFGVPVRKDMEPIWADGRPRIRKWVHIYSSFDIWQKLGELFSGNTHFPGHMGMADVNINYPGARHHELVSVELWNRLNLWQYL